MSLRPGRANRLELLDSLIILRVLHKLSASLLRLLKAVHRVPKSLHVVRRLVLSGLLRAHLSTMLFLCLLERRFVDLLFGLLAEVRLQFEVLGRYGLLVVILRWLNLLLRRLLVWSVHLHLPEFFVVFLNLVRILI